MSTKRERLTFASALSAIITIIATTAITILGELSAPFKAWLKSLTGHHWITKSWAVVIIYLLVLWVAYAAAKHAGERGIRRSLWWLFGITILCTAALILFFTWHFASA